MKNFSPRFSAVLVLTCAILIGITHGPAVAVFSAWLMSVPLLPFALSSMLGVNAQVGTPILVKSPPLFAEGTVRGGSWEEDDSTKQEINLNADEEQFNTTAYDEGEDVKCDFYPNAGFDPKTNDVLTEIGVDTPRSWVINKVSRKRFGKRGLIYSLMMGRHSAQDTTQVAS